VGLLLKGRDTGVLQDPKTDRFICSMASPDPTLETFRESGAAKILAARDAYEAVFFYSRTTARRHAAGTGCSPAQVHPFHRRGGGILVG